MSTTASGIHESPKGKIQKRQKARSNTPLSCKSEYCIKTNSAYFSYRFVFFTDKNRILLDNYYPSPATSKGMSRVLLNF